MTVEPLVGRLVDLTSRRAVGDRKVALLARPATTRHTDGPPELLTTAMTAADGTFVAPRPAGHWRDAFVILDDGIGRLHLELELDGTFPDEVVVFLNELESHLRYAY